MKGRKNEGRGGTETPGNGRDRERTGKGEDRKMKGNGKKGNGRKVKK
jgi:hypothetical protein